MRTLLRVLFLFFIAAAVLAQSRFAGYGGNIFGTPVGTGGWGIGAAPNVTRFGGSRVYTPGWGQQRFTGFKGSGLLAVPFAYPVYVGGNGYDNSAVPGPDPQPQGDPNASVVYPSSPAPVIVKQYANPNQDAGNAEPVASNEPSQPDSPEHYLIALKDHTVYPVVAYFTDGDTLHYFTAGNVHNQVSLTLVDRDLTARLNREMGIDMKLPAEK